MIAEPDVTLTDWGLAVECAILARLIARAEGPAGSGERPPARPWLVLFFASTGAAALTGGAVHGLFPDPASAGQRWLWPATLLAVGVTAWSAWAVGGHMAWGPRVGRVISAAAGVGFAIYALALWRFGFRFALAIASYLPAALFLLGVFAWLRRRSPDRRLWAGAAGIALTFAAAAVQQLRIDIDRTYFDHNALYHVMQAIAFVLIYRGATGALAVSPRRPFA